MSRLERAVQLLLCIVCIVAIWAIIDRKLGESKESASPDRLIGGLIDVPGVTSAHSVATIAVIVSANCHFCKESAPLYKELGCASEASKGRLRFVAASMEAEPDVSKFLSADSVRVDGIVRLDSKQLRSLRIHGTPTMFVLGADKRVQNVYQGMLNEQAREKLRLELRKSIGEDFAGKACLSSKAIARPWQDFFNPYEEASASERMRNLEAAGFLTNHR